MSPIPAATVMVMHAEKDIPTFLLVHRHPNVPVLGNVWVFPGGRLADADRKNGNNNALGACAVRETKEEAGLELHPASLISLLQWETPENIPKRFDTRFFATVLRDRPTVRVDGYEIDDHQWLTAEMALRHHHQNEIQLSPPAYVILSWAASLETVDEFLAYFSNNPNRRIKPRNIPLPDGSCNLFKDDTAYESGDLAADGEKHRLWMRETGWHYEGGPFQHGSSQQQAF
jgi:8-oxo-dGTP pyrophosphatase MutT (NUDIX family)